MLQCYVKEDKNSIPINLFTVAKYQSWLATQNEFTRRWLQSAKVDAGVTLFIPDTSGSLSKIIFCLSDESNFYEIGNLVSSLPATNYKFENLNEADQFALAWGLGSYQFTNYKAASSPFAKLVYDNPKIESIVASIFLVRDLINTPADDMGPTELSKAVARLASHHQAQFNEIVGADLLKENYAGIYTVGRASDDAPRLLELRWGKANHPKITLVGKGVCFDSGGLDIKTSPYMLLMKKDMGGCANVLGLANMIMDAKLPINLRVLIPAVENVISGNAYRPGDIIKSRKGLTIEVNNTDAEGRVVLADALAEAVNDAPELIIDLATLTGAARVALGTELPALFSNDLSLARELCNYGTAEKDFLWHMPLFAPYKEALKSPIADLNNSPLDSYAGAITAALFLQAFVPDSIPWVHIDMMAWNLRSKPGRPQGGEAMAIRAIFKYLSDKYKLE